MSKMLKLMLLILLFSALTTNVFAAKTKPAVTTKGMAVAAATEPTTTPQEKIIPGRYQLFQGKYKSITIDLGTSRKEEFLEGLFLIDTATGELFLCEAFFYVNTNPNSKADKGFIDKKGCSPFKSDHRSLKDE